MLVLLAITSLMERSTCMVLGQSLESFTSAGVPWLCVVLLSLESAELQPELLRGRRGLNANIERAPSATLDYVALLKLLFRTLWLDLLHRLDKIRQRGFGVSIKHSGHGLEEEWIFQTGKSFAFAALQHHNRFCLIDFNDGHPSD